MNYKVITNPEKLRDFIEWLPELADNEIFYLCLFARSKYCKDIAHIKSDKAQLRRFTSTKDRLYNKIWQLESPIGSYTTKESYGGQIPVPQESLALYITINPRNMQTATKTSLIKLIDLVTQPYNRFNPHQEVMSEIQKAKKNSRFVTFDFDVEKKFWSSIEKSIYENINRAAVSVVETRGGFHLIIKTSAIIEEYRKNWYINISRILAIWSSDNDNKGDIMLPVPGTYQGGFTPTFI